MIHARQLEVDRFPFDASADAIRSTVVDTASVAHELLLCSQTIKLPQHFAVFRSVSERHCETKLICELQTTSNCKRIETLAVFPDNSDIVIVNTHLPPFPLINVVMDLVMIFKVTSNNIERGRVFKSVFSVGNPRITLLLLLLLILLLLLLLLLLEENVSTILQLLVWARYL